MKFINYSKIHSLSNLVLLLLFGSIVFSVFGIDSTKAHSQNRQEEKQNTLKRKMSEIDQAFRYKGIPASTFSGENLSSAFARKNKANSNVLSPFGVQNLGDLDQNFGTGGKVTTQVGNSRSEAFAAAVQPDGKFVAAGYSSNNANIDFALVRYTSNGLLDTTFGNGGKVITEIGTGDNSILALKIQPTDGKLIAAGYSSNGTDDDFALARYNTDGSLDASFGTGGIVTTDFVNSSDYIDAVALQPDGKIVAAGYRFDNFYFHFAVARYNTNGTLDTSFGTGGKVTTSLTDFDDLARAVLIQPNGKILVVGEANADFGLVRYDSTGALDTSFDADGKVITSINLFDSAYDAALQPDGKILAAGETGNGSNADFALVRYLPDGTPDSSFGANGVVTTAIGANDEFASSILLQENGKIILGGFSLTANDADFALIRYGINGELDAAFDSDGKVTVDFGSGSFDYINALIIQDGTRVIGVGSSNSNFAAAAFTAEIITYEGDLVSKPNGDGKVQSNDVIQAIRFLNELDNFNTAANEFQRADTAPREQKGNGIFDSADIVQTIRYLNEFEFLTAAGGPSVPISSQNNVELSDAGFGKNSAPQKKTTSAPESPAVTTLRLDNTTGNAGTQVMVNVRVDPIGSEAQFAFSLLFDPNVLNYTGFAAGDTSSSVFSCNATATPGRIRCSAGAFSNNRADTSPVIGEIAATPNQTLIKLIFTVSPAAAPGTTSMLNFANVSAADESATSLILTALPETFTVSQTPVVKSRKRARFF